MGVKPVFVVFDGEDKPVFNGVATNAHDAWENFVLWRVGILRGPKDYQTKRKSFVRQGYRCHQMVARA